MTHDDSANPTHAVRATIVGVVADFMFEGDRRVIVPTLYSFDLDNMSYISVKVPANGVPQALAAIDRIWHAFEPSIAINRHFLETDFERQFLTDEQQGRIFGMFVGIAIFIACSGPVRAGGFFHRAAHQGDRAPEELRRADQGHRAAAALAVFDSGAGREPDRVAGRLLLSAHWLEGYAYRISLNPLYFVGAGLAALIIAWSTVFIHARRVARANPIHALALRVRGRHVPTTI